MGSRAVRGILSCALALLVVACSDDGDGSDTAESSTSSSTTTTVPPGPELETNTDDVVAAMRSLLEFDSWTERKPQAGLARSEEWLVRDGPYWVDVQESLQQQIDRGLVATGSSEILEIKIESQDARRATVLVWKRSDAYEFVGQNETLASPAFDRTLFVFELRREPGGQWRVFDRRIPQQ